MRTYKQRSYREINVNLFESCGKQRFYFSRNYAEMRTYLQKYRQKKMRKNELVKKLE